MTFNSNNSAEKMTAKVQVIPETNVPPQDPTSAPEVDPITLGLIRNYLSSIADEMANTVIRTAYSTIVRDCMDFSTALCDRNGRMIAQGLTIPFQLGSIPFALGATLSKYQGRINPGDVFIMNDPFEGGIHLPDIFLFRPIFYREELIGFSAAVSHHLDIGGRVPGSSACDNTEIFQEGLRIPPLKLYDRGEPSESIFHILEKNVRVPVMTLGDLRSNLAACKSGEKGMLRLAETYGLETLELYYAKLLDYTETMVRSEIRKWQNGEYSFTDYLDDDGVDPDPIAIKVKMIVEDDSITIDFTGTSPQVRGGINCPLPFTTSCCGYALRSVMRTDIPNTSGLFRPIRVIAPEGSILNPVMPAASSMRGVVGFRLADALFGALAQVAPRAVPAAGEGGNSLIIIGGYNKSRCPFIMFDLVGGTWGARPDKDGNDGLTNPASVIANIPAELMELEYPVRLEQYALTRDSGGAGKYRGGLAVVRDWRFLGDQSANLTIRSDRRDFPPYGLFGGGKGAPSRNIVNPGTPAERVLKTKVTDTLRPGDVIRHVQPGGGGWGDPLERDPAAVLRDVINDKVSSAKAEELYGVVIDTARSQVDKATTERKRSAMRSNPGGHLQP
jgi:N-methylhydantoinase B